MPTKTAHASKTNGRPQPPQPTAKVETVTPEVAIEWLKLNTHNRAKKGNKIDQFRGAMERGEWTLTGEAIKFAKSGRLLDGQNRLWAVVLSGVSIDVFVIRGLDEDAQVVMDTGSSRQFADQLSLNGEKDAKGLAAACRLLFMYEHHDGLVGNTRLGRAPTAPQLFTLLDANPELRDFTGPARALRQSLGGSSAVWTLLYYLFSRVDREEADAFMFQVKTGLDLQPGDPALALRNSFLNWSKRTATRLSSLPSHVQAAWTIKAFNAFRQGDRMERATYKPSVEEFPSISTVEFSGA